MLISRAVPFVKPVFYGQLPLLIEPKVSDAVGLGFVAGAFDDYNLVIIGPSFTKLAWLVHFMILMHWIGLNAETDP